MMKHKLKHTAAVAPVVLALASAWFGAATAQADTTGGSDPGEIWVTNNECSYIMQTFTTQDSEIVKAYASNGSKGNPNGCRVAVRLEFVDKSDSSKTFIKDWAGDEGNANSIFDMVSLNNGQYALKTKWLTAITPDGQSYTQTEELAQCLWTGDGVCR